MTFRKLGIFGVFPKVSIFPVMSDLSTWYMTVVLAYFPAETRPSQARPGVMSTCWIVWHCYLYHNTRSIVCLARAEETENVTVLLKKETKDMTHTFENISSQKWWCCFCDIGPHQIGPTALSQHSSHLRLSFCPCYIFFSWPILSAEEWLTWTNKLSLTKTLTGNKHNIGNQIHLANTTQNQFLYLYQVDCTEKYYFVHRKHIWWNMRYPSIWW